MTNQRLTSRESISRAICFMILDFRQWCIAETRSMQHWKSMQDPIVVVAGRMIDDVIAAVEAYRKQGDSSLPCLLLAMQRIKEAPDPSGQPRVNHDIDAVIPSDPQKRKVKVRYIPQSYRLQLAFLVNDVDTAASFTNQFQKYLQVMEKRRFAVDHQLADDIIDRFDMTVLDNSIFPDSADTGEKNLNIGLLDFTAHGLVPYIVAGLNNDIPWDVVVEADMNKQRNETTFVRLNADKQTGVRTVTVVDKP